jgi:hypothetical protein
VTAKYVDLMGEDNGYNSSHAYCPVKGWSKKNYETFSNDFGKGFENGMMEGEKMDPRKKILKLKCHCLLESVTTKPIRERLQGGAGRLGGLACRPPPGPTSQQPLHPASSC